MGTVRIEYNAQFLNLTFSIELKEVRTILRLYLHITYAIWWKYNSWIVSKYGWGLGIIHKRSLVYFIYWKNHDIHATVKSAFSTNSGTKVNMWVIY